MAQNALGQSDNQIFKSMISLEQNDEKAWFSIEKYWGGQSVLRTLKLAVCQGKLNEINWFLVCWYRFMKAKSHVNNFVVVVVKNGWGLLGLWALKSAVLQGPINEMSWFFVCWYKFRKPKSYFNNY